LRWSVQGLVAALVSVAAVGSRGSGPRRRRTSPARSVRRIASSPSAGRVRVPPGAAALFLRPERGRQRAQQPGGMITTTWRWVTSSRREGHKEQAGRSAGAPAAPVRDRLLSDLLRGGLGAGPGPATSATEPWPGLVGRRAAFDDRQHGVWRFSPVGYHLRKGSALLHRQELRRDWELARSGQTPEPVAPLE
jgi:hypothetical protein